MYAASSGVALGITPGSLKLVRNKADITNINNKAPITGIAGVTCSARYGQLEKKKRKPLSRNFILVYKNCI